MISAKFLWGNAFLGGKLQIDAKNSNFAIFETALYMKSVNMPLNDFLFMGDIPCQGRLFSITYIYMPGCQNDPSYVISCSCMIPFVNEDWFPSE